MRSAHLLRGFLVVALLCSIGCASKNKGKIEGTKWINLAGNVKGDPLPEGLLTLEFGADNTLIMKNPIQTHTGKYSLGMGDNVTFTFDQEVEGHKSHVEKITIEGDKLTMSDNAGTVSFKKLK